MRVVAILAVLFVSSIASAQRVLVRGSVTDSAAGTPIASAYVEVLGTRYSALTRDDGSFVIGRIPAGHYGFRVVRLGYEPRTLADVDVSAPDSTFVLGVAMTAAPIPLSAVVVTPGFYGIMQPGLTPSHSLSRQQIETAPQLGEDIFRSVSRLPGVSSNDMSARFAVRGSVGDELFATLDGLELDEPFHLKDIDAALSLVDVSAIAGVELTTGGFSAEYGNRLTGVFSLHSIEPRTDRVHHALSLSIMNARYTVEGGAADGRVGWYLAARRGYLDIALALVSPEDSISPRYYDVFGKVHWDLPRGGRVTLHALTAGDHLNYTEDPADHLNSRYGNHALWATWSSDVTDRLRQRSVLSLTRATWQRDGDVHESDGTPDFFLDDRRTYDALALRQDWQFDAAERLMLKGGVHLKRMSASYDYLNWSRRRELQGGALVTFIDTTSAATAPLGSLVGLYLSPRIQLAKSLIAEVGLRYDAVTYSRDVDVSPRVNLAWEPFSSTSVRAAWGRYVQPQAIYGIPVADGLSTFQPSDRADQFGVGVEQRLPGLLTARLELYDRRMSRLRTRFINSYNDLEVFSEAANDRTRIDPSSGRARGAEFSLARSGRGRTDWSLSYALASATDRVGDRDVPRGMDQRHTVNADWAFRPVSQKWRFAVAWLWHSGWPATSRAFKIDTIPAAGATPQRIVSTIQFGPLNGDRLPEYHRLDLRLTRYWDTRTGRVAVYADCFNVFNSANARGYIYSIKSLSPYRVERTYDTYLPRLPSLGISWEF